MGNYNQLELRFGNEADVPTLAVAEPGFCEDSGKLLVGSSTGNKDVSEPFAAAVSGNWAGSPPTTKSQAINRIAAALATLLGGPIA